MYLRWIDRLVPTYCSNNNEKHPKSRFSVHQTFLKWGFMLPSAHNLCLLQNIPPRCASQTVQSAEESVFAERRYSASVINVNSPHARVQIKNNAALQNVFLKKESFRLSLASSLRRACFTRERRGSAFRMRLAGRVHMYEYRLLMSTRRGGWGLLSLNGWRGHERALSPRCPALPLTPVHLLSLHNPMTCTLSLLSASFIRAHTGVLTRTGHTAPSSLKGKWILQAQWSTFGVLNVPRGFWMDRSSLQQV